MKKYLIILFIIAISFSANAKPLADFCNVVNGVKTAQIHLDDNGTFWIIDYQENKTWKGFYEIAGNLVPGQGVYITFTMDGLKRRGTIWLSSSRKYGD